MSVSIHPRDPVSDAAASFLAPGLGQWLQGRRAAAAYFAGDVLAAFAIGALMPELRAVAWVAAVAVGLWSVVDAAVAARRRPSTGSSIPETP